MLALQTVAFSRMGVSRSPAPRAVFSRARPEDLFPLSRRPKVCELRPGLSKDATSSVLHFSSWKALPASSSSRSLARALARRPSPASALPLCVPNVPPWQQCGWCETLRGGSHFKRPQAERPLAPRAGNAGAGQAAPPPPPPRRAPGLQVPCLLPGLCSDSQSPPHPHFPPCTWSLTFSELRGRWTQ